MYDEPEESGDEGEEDEADDEQRSSNKRQRTHLMEHLTPREQNLVHQYYHNIGRKGPNVHQGYLDSTPEEEQRAVRKFLHAVQVKKNVGEREAEIELDMEQQGLSLSLWLKTFWLVLNPNPSFKTKSDLIICV